LETEKQYFLFYRSDFLLNNIIHRGSIRRQMSFSRSFLSHIIPLLAWTLTLKEKEKRVKFLKEITYYA